MKVEVHERVAGTDDTHAIRSGEPMKRGMELGEQVLVREKTPRRPELRLHRRAVDALHDHVRAADVDDLGHGVAVGARSA